MSKIFVGDDVEGAPSWGESNMSMRSKRRTDSKDITVSKEIQRMQHQSFDKISSIQFCIDGAIGLPLSTTATRVTARLMAHDRSQVGEPSAPSFSHPDSEATTPTFDLHMGWRGKKSSIFSSFQLYSQYYFFRRVVFILIKFQAVHFNHH